MDTAELTPEKVLGLWQEEDGEPDGFTLVEEGDWVSEHKYQMRSDVLRHDQSGRFFAIHQCRSGSYHSDYHDLDPDCTEVWPVVITRTEYVARKPA